MEGMQWTTGGPVATQAHEGHSSLQARLPAHTRVLLVEDHAMFREAIRLMLSQEADIEVVGELGDGSGVAQAVDELRPELVVMDVSMPGVNGIEATRALLARCPGQKVLALSAFNYRQFVTEMLQAGATGYVIKSAAGHQLVQAIRMAAQGKTYLCPEAAEILVASSRRSGAAHAGAPENKRLGRRRRRCCGCWPRARARRRSGRRCTLRRARSMCTGATSWTSWSCAAWPSSPSTPCASA